MTDDLRATVRGLLAAAGLTPSEEEIENLARSYPALREAADSLFSDEISRFLPAWLPSDDDLEAR